MTVLLILHRPRRQNVPSGRRVTSRRMRDNEDLFVSSPWWPAPAPGIVAGARRCQARSCPRPRRGLGRGCSLTPVPLRLVRRLSGAGGDVSGRWLVVAVLELAVAREWLVRRAGPSGCEPAALETASFPECPPGSLRGRMSWSIRS